MNLRFWRHKSTGHVIDEPSIRKLRAYRYPEFEENHPGPATHRVNDASDDGFGTELAMFALDSGSSAPDTSSNSGDFGGFGGGDFGGAGAGGGF